jgi:uncharacterized protein YecE (DUF72 family)
MQLFIGTAGWSIPAPHAKAFAGSGTHLERYGARLRCTEINSSFYRPHQRKTYERWAASVPKDFRFCVKLPGSITHERRLKGCKRLIQRFLEEAAGLGPKLAVILVQLPPSLSYEARAVAAFFSLLRRHTKVAIACEPRHATWFTREADAALRKLRVARVAADPPRAPADGQPGGWQGLHYWRLHGSPRLYYSSYDNRKLKTLAAALSPNDWYIFDNTMSGAALSNALTVEKLARLPRGKQSGTGFCFAGYGSVMSEEKTMARKYSKAASKKVEKVMHERKKGTLKSGSGKKVKSRKQAIAIGLSEARKEGKKVPKKAKKTKKKKKS